MIDSSCSTTGTTTSNLNVIRYGVIPEFIYIVGRPYGGSSWTGTVNHYGPHEFLVFSGIRVAPLLIFLCSIV
jgi:hypothetical protein